MGSSNFQPIYQPRELYSIASYLFSMKKYDELIRICRNIRELNPQIGTYCYFLEIQVLLEKNLIDESLELLAEAEKKYCGNYIIDDCYGLIYTRKGNYDLAVQYYLKALKKTRKSLNIAKYSYKLALIYCYQKKYKESLENIKSALLIEPENISVFILLISIAHHYSIHNVVENYLFRCILFQRDKYQNIYPTHKITRLEYFHMENVITKKWNNEILTQNDKIEQCMKMDMEDWFETFDVNLDPVYEKMKNYKKNDLIIKFDIGEREDDDETDREYEEENDTDGEDDSDEDYDEDYDEEDVIEEDFAGLHYFDDGDSHSNSDFILALVYLAGISMTKAIGYYSVPSLIELEEKEIMNWANEIMDMIYDLKYNYQAIIDPGAKESIDKIVIAASKYMNKRLAEGIINQFLRLIESKVTIGKQERGQNDPDDICLN